MRNILDTEIYKLVEKLVLKYKIKKLLSNLF